MPYSHTTFGEAKSRLAESLGDPGKVFFIDAELGRYIIEALRAWGLHSEYWVEGDSFKTTANNAFYDISTALTNSSQSFTTTDREIISDLLYQIMEPQIVTWPGGWVGTEMFTLEEIVDLIEKSRALYLRETAQIVSVVSQGQGAIIDQVDLNEQTVFVRRASWQTVGETLRRPIWQIDTHQQQTTSRNAIRPEPGTPKAYTLYHQPLLTLELSPPPENPGTLRMLNCLSGAALDPTVAPTTINLPDDCAWLLRYRTLSDLFNGDGLSRAPQMAQYCQDRWKLGLEAVRRYHSVTRAYPNGIQTLLSSLAQRDSASARWESVTGAPKRLALPAWNMLALSPVPNGEFTIALDVISKAPIPPTDDDFIQIAPAHMQAIYDYAQHIARLKMQGAEFFATFPLLESFLAQAEQYRAVKSAEAPTYWDLEQMGPWRERVWRPVWSTAPVRDARAFAAASGPEGGEG